MYTAYTLGLYNNIILSHYITVIIRLYYYKLLWHIITEEFNEYIHGCTYTCSSIIICRVGTLQYTHAEKTPYRFCGMYPLPIYIYYARISVERIGGGKFVYIIRRGLSIVFWRDSYVFRARGHNIGRGSYLKKRKKIITAAAARGFLKKTAPCQRNDSYIVYTRRYNRARPQDKISHGARSKFKGQSCVFVGEFFFSIYTLWSLHGKSL